MKYTLLIILFFLFIAPGFAQYKDYDSIAYENQRAKINNLLNQRSQKFGQYDASLGMHTGIFGFQTKKDIRYSNEILMDIVKTDDTIFRQLKVLLSYRSNQLDLRTLQQKQSQDRAKEIQTMSEGFMRTINKLRDQNEKLKADIVKAEKTNLQTKQYAAVIILLMFASILLLLLKKKRVKA